jgi:VWFA-related protein
MFHAPRRRSAVVFAAGLVSLAASLPQQQQSPPPPQTPQRQQPIFRSGVDLVAVDVYPRRDGRIVEGLTAADFEVFEDGKPQAVEQLEFVRVEPAGPLEEFGPPVTPDGLTNAADPRRRLFVTYLDMFHTLVPGAAGVSTPVRSFYTRVHGDGDLFGFLTQTIPAPAMVIGRHPRAVDDALEKHWPTNRVFDLRKPQDQIEQLLELCYNNTVSAPLISRHRMRRTMRHLDELFQFVSQLRPSRTVVLLLADHWPTPATDRGLLDRLAVDTPAITGDVTRRGTPIDRMRGATEGAGCQREAMAIASMDLASQHRELIQRAQQHNILIYAMSPSQYQAAHTRLADGLIELAHNTGGKMIGSLTDLERSAGWLMDDTSAFYLLGYRSTNTAKDGTLRRIEVRTKIRDVRIVARRTYRAPSAEAMAALTAKDAAAAAVPPEVTDALTALAATERASSLVVAGAEWHAGRQLRIVAEIPEDAYRQGNWARGADVVVTLASGDVPIAATAQARLESGARSVSVPVDIGSSQAPWRATVRLTAGGDVLTERTVVTLPGTTLTGDPLYSRGPLSPRAPVAPTANPVFLRTERVRVEWPARGALDRREGRLLSQRGQPLPVPVEVSERMDGTTPIVVAEVRLSPLTFGDYVIELTVGRGPETELRFAAFRLAR